LGRAKNIDEILPDLSGIPDFYEEKKGFKKKKKNLI
jgi:hypothetical protein